MVNDTGDNEVRIAMDNVHIFNVNNVQLTRENQRLASLVILIHVKFYSGLKHRY
jgi:hypothetical protein